MNLIDIILLPSDVLMGSTQFLFFSGFFLTLAPLVCFGLQNPLQGFIAKQVVLESVNTGFFKNKRMCLRCRDNKPSQRL
jgi:hypothetical protein